MHLHQIGIQLTVERGEFLQAREITPAGLHGIFYDVIGRFHPDGATWLHEHDAPKPYTLAPAHYDAKRRELAGMLVSTMCQDASELVAEAWNWAYAQELPLTIGKQDCYVERLMFFDNISYESLVHAPPCRRVGLHFLTPTAFKQGRGDLLFPLPRNVFARPFQVWQRFVPQFSDAPERYLMPDDWLDWCASSVFATRHEIKTVKKNINRNKRFAGFVGKAWFSVQPQRDEPRAKTEQYSGYLNALAQFANFSGIGRKTTMGMGAVEVIH